MSEPANTAAQAGASLVGGLVILAGPTVGPWIAVAAASFAGSLWTIGAAETEDKWRALLLLLRINLTACVLTGCVAVPVVSYDLLPCEYALPAVAFGLGALGAHYKEIITAASGRLRAWIGGQQ